MNESRDEEMKCPACQEPLLEHYRQQGGVRTHIWFECNRCNLAVWMNKIEKYESPIDRFKKWLNARKMRSIRGQK